MKPQPRNKPTAHATPRSLVLTVGDSHHNTPDTPNSSGHPRIPAPWQWHYRTLLHLRNRLLRAHTEHARQADEPPDLHGVDLTDTVQDKLDRDLLWAELGAEDDKLFEVDCALQRIRDGVYGFCEETGNPIPPTRLRAVPWTRFSRSAAEQHEHRPPERAPSRS
jgi:DnaK suppressor protein